jgi:hypothetical protein
MAESAFSGPLVTYGNMGAIPSGFSGGVTAVPMADQGPGPNCFYQGAALLDPRFVFPDDKVQGYTGVLAATLQNTDFVSVDQIPLTASTTAIAAAQNVTSGTAMTLVSTISSSNNTPAVPIQANWSSGNAVLNGGSVVNVLALDFGFAFGTCVASNSTITVADSTKFETGMPLVVGGVGNSGGTACLLTNVASIVDATHITVTNAPLAASPTGGAPIGAGNLWGTSENGYPTPTAHLPYLAKGAGLFLDPLQSVARAVTVTGSASATGGHFVVAGYDIYGQPMTENINAASGATTTAGAKAWKFIASVTPQFTDAHNYSVGTTDVFGFHFRTDRWEQTTIFWAGSMATSSTGWTAADTTSPATSTTGDVRGTVASASLATIGSASNGSISSLALTGRRLVLRSRPGLWNVVFGTPVATTSLYGSVQA